MRIRFLFLALAAATLITGCGHTNNLAQYNIAGKTALFRVYASTTGSSFAVVESPKEDNLVADIAAAVGSGILSDQARKKLQNAVVPEEITEAVSKGMWTAATDYLALRPVHNIGDDPDLIVETELTDFKLVSGSSGIVARVKAKSRIIDRRSGGLVWDNSESHTINLSNTLPGLFGPDAVQTGVGVFNALQLVNMSDDEIRRVINSAAEVAGREIGETLREDVVEMREE